MLRQGKSLNKFLIYMLAKKTFSYNKLRYKLYIISNEVEILIIFTSLHMSLMMALIERCPSA